MENTTQYQSNHDVAEKNMLDILFIKYNTPHEPITTPIQNKAQLATIANSNIGRVCCLPSVDTNEDIGEYHVGNWEVRYLWTKKSTQTPDFNICLRCALYWNNKLIEHNWYSQIIVSWENGIVKYGNSTLKLLRPANSFIERLGKLRYDINQINTTQFWKEYIKQLRPHPRQLYSPSDDKNLDNYYEVLTLLKERKCGIRLAQEESEFL